MSSNTAELRDSTWELYRLLNRYREASLGKSDEKLAKALTDIEDFMHEQRNVMFTKLVSENEQHIKNLSYALEAVGGFGETFRYLRAELAQAVRLNQQLKEIKPAPTGQPKE